MQRWFEGRAFDGLNLHIGHPSQFRRFTDEVLPILRERGLVRGEYESSTLRGNLGLPIPENRYTRERQEEARHGVRAGARHAARTGSRARNDVMAGETPPAPPPRIAGSPR